MDEHDVHNDWAEQRQTQRDIVSDQEQQTANHLQDADNINVMTFHERFGEVADQRRGWRWHWNKVQEDVRTEDDENESEKNASNNGSDFHARMVA